MCTPLRADLLAAVCTYLPEEEHEFYSVLPPTQFLTHFEVYLALRSNAIDLPPELAHDFRAGLTTAIEADAELRELVRIG